MTLMHDAADAAGKKVGFEAGVLIVLYALH
jgi:hypothetical protein